QIYTGYKGRSGAALNVELDFKHLFNFRPKLTRDWLSADIYLFADAGFIELGQYDNSGTDFWHTVPADFISDFRMDAGIGTTFTIHKWGVFDKSKPLTIRFDMPLFINRPPFGHPQYFAPRW